MATGTTVATSPALSADFLLYGAFHAAHQAWHLLEDAVTLFRSRSYPTCLALSVYSLEEIGRGKFYLEQRDLVLDGQVVSVETLASRQTRNHIWKLVQAEIPVTVGIASAGPPPAPDSPEGIALGQRLLQLRKVMEESAPKRAHSQRLSALYVDVHPSGIGWLTPSKLVRREEADEKLGAADLAYSLFRLRLAEPKQGTELAAAKEMLSNLAKLPEPSWDVWSWEPKDEESRSGAV